MCGRFDCHTSVGDIIKTFGAVRSGIAYEPNYNVAPARRILIINNEGKKRLLLCRWGFMPSQEKDLSFGNRLINARAETVATLPTFRTAFMKQRCLVIADGFYEWRREGMRKVPLYVRLKSGRPFGMAGLCNTWVSDTGEAVCTCTIITTGANDLLSEVHDRMPVIVARDKEDFYLDPDNKDRAGLQDILTPYPSYEMVYYRVSTSVNSAAFNSPENIRPIVPAG